jgi:hypothetical protein
MSDKKEIDELTKIKSDYEIELKIQQALKEQLAFLEQQLTFSLQLFLKIARDFNTLGKQLTGSSTQLFNTSDLITVSYNKIMTELENKQKKIDQLLQELESKKGQVSP